MEWPGAASAGRVRVSSSLGAFSNEADGAVVINGYFLAASRGLPQGVANFYSSDSGLVYCSGSVRPRLRHRAYGPLDEEGGCSYRVAIFWQRSDGHSAIRHHRWAHPVTAAGVLFPGWGWWGLVAVTAASWAS